MTRSHLVLRFFSVMTQKCDMSVCYGRVTFGHDIDHGRGQSRPNPCLNFLPLLPFLAYQVSYDNMDATESRTMKARREGRFALVLCRDLLSDAF